MLSACAYLPDNDIAAARLPQASVPLHAKGSFYTYDGIEKKLAEFRLAYSENRQPDLVKVISIGKTWEGRNIYAMKISRDASTNSPDKPDVLLFGGIHACEWIGVETMMYFAERLLASYGKDDYVTYLMDNAEIWIVPVVNPDGFVYSQSVGSDWHRLWRKNRRSLPDGSVGVDLNRCFPNKWRLPGDSPASVADDSGASDDPANPYYRGEAAPGRPDQPAVIEKEAEALINLVDDPEHNFVMVIDYHSFSEKILYPPCHTRDIYNKDMDTFQRLADGMVELINRQRGAARGGILKGLFVPTSRYEALQSSKLYHDVCTGTGMDFFYEKRGLISLGVELSPGFTIQNHATGNGYKIDASEIAPVGEENFPAMLMAVDWAAGPPRIVKIIARQNDKTVYESEWKDGKWRVSAAGAIEAGEAELTVVFSKPAILHPRYALVQEWAGVRSIILPEPFDSSATQGRWSRTNYENDTFTAAITVSKKTEGLLAFNPADLNIVMRDSNGLDLDLEPGTRAVYVTGEGLWLNYERTRNHKPPINRDSLLGKTGSR
jgi:predicted deacylase